MKKESATRGYMTPAEVYAKFSDMSPEAAIKRIYNIDKRGKKFLSEETRQSVQDVREHFYGQQDDLSSARSFRYDERSAKRQAEAAEKRASRSFEESQRDRLEAREQKRVREAQFEANQYASFSSPSHRDIMKQDSSKAYQVLMEKLPDHPELGEEILKKGIQEYSNALAWLSTFAEVGKELKQMNPRIVMEEGDSEIRLLSGKLKEAESHLKEHNKKYGSSLEGRAMVPFFAIAGIGAGAFFYSTKITGNVIGVSTQTSSVIGIGLLIVGLIAGFLWLKGK